MTCLFKDSGYHERVPTWSSYLHMHRRPACTPDDPDEAHCGHMSSYCR